MRDEIKAGFRGRENKRLIGGASGAGGEGEDEESHRVSRVIAVDERGGRAWRVQVVNRRRDATLREIGPVNGRFEK